MDLWVPGWVDSTLAQWFHQGPTRLGGLALLPRAMKGILRYAMNWNQHHFSGIGHITHIWGDQIIEIYCNLKTAIDCALCGGAIISLPFVTSVHSEPRFFDLLSKVSKIINLDWWLWNINFTFSERQLSNRSFWNSFKGKRKGLKHGAEFGLENWSETRCSATPDESPGRVFMQTDPPSLLEGKSSKSALLSIVDVICLVTF